MFSDILKKTRSKTEKDLQCPTSSKGGTLVRTVTNLDKMDGIVDIIYQVWIDFFLWAITRLYESLAQLLVVRETTRPSFGSKTNSIPRYLP